MSGKKIWLFWLVLMVGLPWVTPEQGEAAPKDRFRPHRDFPPGLEPSGAREFPAGPIWNHKDAKIKCSMVCQAVGGEWTGQWRTVKAAEKSLCQCGGFTRDVVVSNIDRSLMLGEWPFDRQFEGERYWGKIVIDRKVGRNKYTGKNYTSFISGGKKHAVVMDVDAIVTKKKVTFHGINFKYTKNPNHNKVYYPDNFVCRRKIGYFDCYSYDGVRETVNNSGGNFTIQKEPSFDEPVEVEPEPLPLPEPRPLKSKIAGLWESRFGEVELRRDGGDVTGDYGKDGRIYALVDGNVVEGVWVRPVSKKKCRKSRHGSRYWGRMVFRFYGDHFNGFWSYCNASPNREWNGFR
ncbi:MAG: mannan-binding lectin [Magnetococcales bacterium]|nr:mannan-binding lectin [Magnetococcales bacterium]